jgi:hypothetical protein
MGLRENLGRMLKDFSDKDRAERARRKEYLEAWQTIAEKVIAPLIAEAAEVSREHAFAAGHVSDQTSEELSLSFTTDKGEQVEHTLTFGLDEGYKHMSVTSTLIKGHSLDLSKVDGVRVEADIETFYKLFIAVLVTPSVDPGRTRASEQFPPS